MRINPIIGPIAVACLTLAAACACTKDYGMADQTLETLVKLDKIIETKDELEMQKEARISEIRNETISLKNNGTGSQTRLYDAYRRIYDEYIKYNSDSAMHYALLKLDFIKKTDCKERDMVWDAYHAVAERYMLSGMYKEAETIVAELEEKTGEHPSHLFHTLYSGLSNRSSDENLKEQYLERANRERDIMYGELPEDHIARCYIQGDILLESGKAEEAYHFLITKYSDKSLTHSEKAIISYQIGNAFKAMGDKDETIRWYAESAIHDLMGCCREYASLPSLATELYSIGDINRAYSYITRSIEDAQKLNAVVNMQRINDSLPVIADSYNSRINKNRHSMLTLIAVLAVIAVILICASAIAFRNAVKVRKISHKLQGINSRLEAMNVELKKNMEALTESDRLKQAYIGRYIDQCSSYIGKLDQYRSYLRKTMKNGDVEELRQALKSDEYINNELKDFYSQFDATFLDLFPDFIDRLNGLLKPEARIDINPEEGILTTELRVFALIQLGVTDSVKISEFLRRSVSTVYNYRVKLRNAASGDRERFEEDLVRRP